MNYGNIQDFCLKEMFRRVGEKYPNLKLMRDRNWFQRRTWTEEEEEDYRKWMVGVMRKKLRWSKKHSEIQASYVLLMYGWKRTPAGCLVVRQERRLK